MYVAILNDMAHYYAFEFPIQIFKGVIDVVFFHWTPDASEAHLNFFCWLLALLPIPECLSIPECLELKH